MKNHLIFVLIYFCVISLAAVIITVADKIAAINHKQRVPEATLMTVGLFGGSLMMYLTMKTIRHKTKHKKFMIGLPLEILFNASLVALFLFKYYTII